MKNLVEQSQENKPVGRVTDIRNGSVMEFAIFLNPRDDGAGYRFSSKFSHTYPVEQEKAGEVQTIWKEKKSFSGNDFPRLGRLAREADDLEQALRLQLKAELKDDPAPAVPTPTL